MTNVAVYILPVIVGIIVVFGLIKGVPLFDVFCSGAKEGFQSTVSILPALVGLVVAVAMLRASGALELIFLAIWPITDFLCIPPDVIPLALLRPISGSGSLAIVDSVLDECGVNSYAGRLASVLMGSTETTFYTIAIYFGAIGTKKTRHVIPAALSADIMSLVISSIVVRLLFG